MTVKQLYLRAYDTLTDAEIGRAMKRKYSEQFSDCADLSVAAVEDARQRTRGTLGFRALEVLRRTDPEFVRVSTQAQIAVLDDEEYQPASQGLVTAGTAP